MLHCEALGLVAVIDIKRNEEKTKWENQNGPVLVVECTREESLVYKGRHGLSGRKKVRILLAQSSIHISK